MTATASEVTYHLTIVHFCSDVKSIMPVAAPCFAPRTTIKRKTAGKSSMASKIVNSVAFRNQRKDSFFSGVKEKSSGRPATLSSGQLHRLQTIADEKFCSPHEGHFEEAMLSSKIQALPGSKGFYSPASASACTRSTKSLSFTSSVVFARRSKSSTKPSATFLPIVMR